MEAGELSRPLEVEASAAGLNFNRPHRRVVLLLFLAPVFYEVWWYWQFFAFTRREGFPRSRRFWWLLVPIYNWVILYRQFDDLKQAAIRVAVPAFNSGLAIWLVIFSWWAGTSSNRISDAHGSFAVFVVSSVLIAIAGFLVQPTANAYLRSKYPEAPPIGMTWGELTAAALGIVLFALVIVITFTSVFASTSTAPTTVPRPAAATHMVSSLRPIAVRTGDTLRLAGTRVGCQASRDQGAVWLDCIPFTSSFRPIPGGVEVSISDRAVILNRVGSNGSSRPLVQRAEPSSSALVGVPLPRRKPQTGVASVGAVLPIGGSSVICDIERSGHMPTLFCGLANKVTGPNSALNISYLPSSYGVTVSSVAAALIRWNRDGSYTLVTRRIEPAR